MRDFYNRHWFALLCTGAAVAYVGLVVFLASIGRHACVTR